VVSAAGKPVFGTLVALLRAGEPVLGLIDQPITRERWLGVAGRGTTLNGARVAARACGGLGAAYLYATTPHMFAGASADAFARVRDQVREGCDYDAYGLLAAGLARPGLRPSAPKCKPLIGHDQSARRAQVRCPLYGCDCYAYGLLAAGHVDLVVEADMKPYDYLPLVPVVAGAGGRMTDWQARPARRAPPAAMPAGGGPLRAAAQWARALQHGPRRPRRG